jgi:cobalt-zinc-cadmium efflux system membrane fusion protein
MPPRSLSWLGLLLLAACDPGHDHPHPHAVGGEEENRVVQVSAWDERFEIFLEHPPVVVDVPTPFATHVSDLTTLEPRRKGKVVFALRQGDGPAIEHAEPEPQRAGIYVPELKFPKAGEWSVSLRVDERVIDLPKLTVYASKEEAKKASGPEPPAGILFLKEQQWRVLLKTEPVGKRKLVERVRVSALVAAKPGLRAAVVPPVAGRLIGKALPSLGDRVEAGQVLALVQPPFSEHAARLLEARAEAVRAKLALDQAELTLARVKKLADSRAAKAAQDAALALKDAYERSGVVTIEGGSPALEARAPIAGVVVEIQAALGEHVASDKAVFRILDASTVHLEARIPEADLPRVEKGTSVLVERPRGVFQPLEARRVFLAPEVDPATRTTALVFEAGNADGALRIGSALTLHLETARVEDALAVPATAVVEEDARPVAFVQLSGETFEKRYLKLGLKEGPWIQVLEGLAEGERVVTKEAMAVRLASVSNVIPAHGHAH